MSMYIIIVRRAVMTHPIGDDSSYTALTEVNARFDRSAQVFMSIAIDFVNLFY